MDAICLRLEQTGFDAIQLNRKPIAVFSLWATQLEISHQPRKFGKRAHAIRRLELWDRIHLANPGPTAVYLDALLNCFDASGDLVTERPGSERVTRTASASLLHALSGMGPTSEVTTEIRQRYLTVIPPTANFENLSCSHAMNAIHALLIGSRERRFFEWVDYKPCSQERVFFAAALVKVAYARPLHGKVPRWIHRFVIHSLSQDPPPPTSVVLDCLLIVASDLDCDISNIGTASPDERYANTCQRPISLTKNLTSGQLREVSDLITQKLTAIVKTAVPGTVLSKRKAISTLFPYAVSREREGRHKMLDMFLRLARVPMQSGFAWRRIEPLITALLVEESPIPLKQAAILASPHVHWRQSPDCEHLVRLWAAAASAVPYTDNIGQSVVDTLFQIAHSGSLSPHIPVSMWSWLNKRPSLYPICWGRYWGTDRRTLRMILSLGDIKILTSYLLLVWSEWDNIRPGSLDEMCSLIKEDFSGTEMGDHRQDLLRRLDHVMGQFDLGLEHFQQHKPSIDASDIRWMKGQYGKLEKILLGIDQRARTILTRELLQAHHPSRCTNSYRHTQDVTPSSRTQSPFRVHSCATGTLPIPSPRLPPNGLAALEPLRCCRPNTWWASRYSRSPNFYFFCIAGLECFGSVRRRMITFLHICNPYHLGVVRSITRGMRGVCSYRSQR